MTTTLPLIADFNAQAVLAWRDGAPVTHGEFVAEALALAQRLPSGDAINLCADRYRFMLAFCAVCLRGGTNLLPASGAPDVIEALLSAAPERYRLDDAMVEIAPQPPAERVPRIAAAHIAAIAYTSGSTGAPQAHLKSFAVLVRTAKLARRVFLPGHDSVNIVATVPPQHMYGLETTVFFALAAGCASHQSKPFFPADLRDALAAVPAPRLLITTPVHLRALVGAGITLPPLRLIISATAPLSLQLAHDAERVLAAPVHEIYGCTEAGSMASRRLSAGERWQLHPRMRIETGNDATHFFGGHLPASIQVHDQIEPDGARRFHLLGRNADMLKVAGKRASLADLTQRLLAVPGVEDAVLFLPEGAERPAALVVAPLLSEQAILAALAPQMDAVFLPRPLRKVAQLPRDELGKLPRAQLLAMMRA